MGPDGIDVAHAVRFAREHGLRVVVRGGGHNVAGAAREIYRDMQLNCPGFAEEGGSLIRASYGENYARLQEIKRRYDPDNVFRHNLNIPPAP